MNGGYLITFRSITYAQKGERILKEMGVSCTLQRTPKILTQRGCGYCLRLGNYDIASAIAELKNRHTPFGKVYAVDAQGTPEEWK